jgi:hypothetical protein
VPMSSDIQPYSYRYCPCCGRLMGDGTYITSIVTNDTTAPLIWDKERVNRWLLDKGALRPEDV